METETNKPDVELVGGDGNAFVIINACKRAARQAGWSDEKWEAVQSEMMNSDYDHLLQTVMKYFDVY